jgi:signal transduction histidine kinase
LADLPQRTHLFRGSFIVMLAPDVLDSLASLPLFEHVPPTELEWLCARAEVLRFAPGTIAQEIGAALDEMWIVVDGRFSLLVPRGGSWRRFSDVGRGFIAGTMPYSRLRAVAGRVVAEEDASVVTLSQSHFRDLIHDCPELTTALVHNMIDRARDFRTQQLQDERMQSLGRLAAGLAHELNNPASGASSHARSLVPLLDDLQAASTALVRARLTDEQLERIGALRAMCAHAAPSSSALAAADREEEFSDWLLRHGIDSVLASSLASSSVSVSALDALAAVMPAETLAVALRWVGGDAAVRQVAGQITAATGRIHHLVRAVKGFTFMDRDGVPDNVDIARGLADTVAMLESKSRAKSIRVHVETAEDLPLVYGIGSELNQVWEKLIDNALDAARIEGTVNVTASRRGDSVVVRVMDDGPGVLEEHRARIFDPFFTTKPVGLGVGLGLDIARRYAHLNDGDLDFTSQPGRTVFRVQLPIAGSTKPTFRGAP